MRQAMKSGSGSCGGADKPGDNDDVLSQVTGVAENILEADDKKKLLTGLRSEAPEQNDGQRLK